MDSQRYGSFRPRWSWILAALICYAPGGGSRQLANADEPAKTVNTVSLNDEVETLVEQLNSPEFATREAASKRLSEIGAPALEKLRKAKLHPAIEVRERASRIYEEVDKAIFETVTKKFIREADGTQSFGLPAWDVFRSIAGDSKTSRLMFVSMLRSQNDLARYIEAASTAKGTANAAAAFEQLASRASAEAERLRVRNDREETPDIGDTVGLLVACSLFGDSSVPIASNEVNEVIVASLYCGPQTECFTKAGYGRCMRALTGRWISQTQAALADDVLLIAMQRSIPEGAIVARRQLDASTETRVLALQCLSRFGNEADVPSVSKLLNDESIFCEFPDQGSIGLPRDDIREEYMPPPGLQRQKLPTEERAMIVRVNDVALAVCMTLGSEDLSKVFPKYQPSATNALQVLDCAFASDGQEYHKLAIARWKKEHPQLAEKAN